jgi:DNA-directed RNA polymerase subunit RPC12/RpoP
MAIQFRCAQCGHPIEVDDPHAGQTAACPYCRHVMSVPQQSTYQPDAAVPARPLGDAAGSPSDTGPPPGMPPPERPLSATDTARQRAARTFGGYALSCMLLAIALFAIGITRSALLLRGSGVTLVTSQPSPEQFSDLERQMRQIGADPWFAIPVYGGLFFALTGLVLGIVSLTQGISGNWRGLVAVIVCSLFFLCLCGEGMFMMLSGIGGAAGA